MISPDLSNNDLRIEVVGMHTIGPDCHLDDSFCQFFHCCPSSGGGTSFVSPTRVSELHMVLNIPVTEEVMVVAISEVIQLRTRRRK